MNTQRFWSWFWLILGTIYFVVPLIATIDFSLRARKGTLSLDAYANIFDDPKFFESFTFSAVTAVAAIALSWLLIVPTAYWVHLKLPRFRPVMELLTLLPFVIPAVVLVFGLIRTYSMTLLNTRTGGWVLLTAAYIVLSFPYMYRAIDTGMRAINIRTLTEAAQSLGADWQTVIFRVIFPNLRVALLNGAFITFAIVMGEFTIAALLAQPAFGPYMNLLSSSKVYEPSALAVISFALTWGAIGIVQLLGQGTGQKQVGGPR
ncbi:MAG TPA: ABC transporter permease subunit [Synechococcales cyanobacterium M55_K2018_004]|nr:ABC transporter permease subunit [Synechococcales cyanobacterium M55_K2018_004]